MATESSSIAQAADEITEYNFRELLDALNEYKDLILTIPSDQVTELRDGFQARKSKDNYAMKKKGVLPPPEVLDFTIYPARDSNNVEIEGQTCVRVKLLPRKSIDIIKMEIPSGDI